MRSEAVKIAFIDVLLFRIPKKNLAKHPNLRIFAQINEIIKRTFLPIFPFFAPLNHPKVAGETIQEPRKDFRISNKGNPFSLFIYT